jgi:hypothetical protein
MNRQLCIAWWRRTDTAPPNRQASSPSPGLLVVAADAVSGWILPGDHLLGRGLGGGLVDKTMAERVEFEEVRPGL